MAVEINGKVYRNLPEQVKKNQEDIEELQPIVEEQGDAIEDCQFDISVLEDKVEDLEGLNIENGATTGSLEQKFDGSTFNFVNPNSPLDGQTITIGIASGTYATMLGGKGRVEGKRSFVNGTQVIANGNYAHAEGNNTQAAGVNSHSEGIQTYASGSAAHAEGSSTAATETGAHSEGYGTHADGVYTHAEGSTNFVLGDNAHAEGGSNVVGVYSGPEPTPGPAPDPGTAVHAEGMGSHAEGNNNTITGAYSHAEGQGNTITSNRAHAEGNGNTVSGLFAHAEGNSGVASGEGAHSEGLSTHAVGNYSHAEGAATYANGLYSHAAGQDSAANGQASFASGYHLAANRNYQTVLGKYNLGQSPNTLLEVGNGTAENARSNAFEVYQDGTVKANNQKLTSLCRHHFDIVIGNQDLPLIPAGSRVSINVNALSTSKTPWATLSELDGGGYIVAAFGTIVYPAIVTNYVFELKIFYSSLGNGTLLLNVHDLTDNTVKAVAITTVGGGMTPNTFPLLDSVTEL